MFINLAFKALHLFQYLWLTLLLPELTSYQRLFIKRNGMIYYNGLKVLYNVVEVLHSHFTNRRIITMRCLWCDQCYVFQLKLQFNLPTKNFDLSWGEDNYDLCNLLRMKTVNYIFFVNWPNITPVYITVHLSYLSLLKLLTYKKNK